MYTYVIVYILFYYETKSEKEHEIQEETIRISGPTLLRVTIRCNLRQCHHHTLCDTHSVQILHPLCSMCTQMRCIYKKKCSPPCRPQTDQLQVQKTKIILTVVPFQSFSIGTCNMVLTMPSFKVHLHLINTDNTNTSTQS